MRRNRIRSGNPRSWRAGVIARVITKNRMVQSPVKWVMNSIGLAPSWLCSAYHASASNGMRHNPNASDFTHGFLIGALVVLFQVHAGVQRRHLLAIPVER